MTNAIVSAEVPGRCLDGVAADARAEETWIDRRASEQAARATQARQQSTRRRGVEPATCDRQYSPAEVEFMNAMQLYKQQSGRMFPTWSEVLEVLGSLGYRKAGEPVAVSAQIASA